MTRIVFQPVEELDSPHVPGTGWTDLLWSGVAAALALLVGLAVLFLYAFLRWDWRDIGGNLLLALLLSVVFGVAVIVRRLFVFERTEKLQVQETRRRWWREDEEWRQTQRLDDDRHEQREPNAAKIDLIARRILTRYYAGQSITRDACTAEGVCNFSEWNQVNDLLKKRGLRRGHKVTAANFAEAWAAWLEVNTKATRFRFVDGEPVPAE